jgi:hypothetical protein
MQAKKGSSDEWSKTLLHPDTLLPIVSNDGERREGGRDRRR